MQQSLKANSIQGIAPLMFQTFIDYGMRAGIPNKLWKAVIRIYNDGGTLQEFTGNAPTTRECC